MAGVLVLGGLVGFAWGFESHRNQRFPHALLVSLFTAEPPPLDPDLPPGRWSTLTGQRPTVGKRLDSVAEQLAALGYLDGTVEAPDEHGIVRHDPERTSPGLNVVVSGHAPEAQLMDNHGVVHHTWARSYPEAFGRPFPDEAERYHYWRRAKLTDDGGMLALFPQLGAMRIDWDSEVVWTWEGFAHHDLTLAPGGETWLLAREERVVADFRDTPVFEDHIVVLDASGREVRRVSVLEALRRSRYAPVLTHAAPHSDILHTNTLKVVPDNIGLPGVRAGMALVSLRALDLVAVIDLDAEEVVWATTGQWHRQHEPSLLPGPRLLVFDNASRWPRSRVVELGLLGDVELWSYDGGTRAFASKTCGTAHRLPNGNTLAVATDTGRAVEVTRDGEVVWEFVSPFRAGEQGELVATLFDVFRVPESALQGLAVGAQEQPGLVEP